MKTALQIDSELQSVRELRYQTWKALEESTYNSINNPYQEKLYRLTEKVKKLEKEYRTDEFVYGNNPKCTIVKKGRIENVGEFQIRIEAKNGVIKAMTMLGDYFIVGNIDDIVRPLKGVELTWDAMAKALPEKLDKTIMNLKKQDFLSLILG